MTIISQPFLFFQQLGGEVLSIAVLDVLLSLAVRLYTSSALLADRLCEQLLEHVLLHPLIWLSCSLKVFRIEFLSHFAEKYVLLPLLIIHSFIFIAYNEFPNFFIMSYFS